MSSRFDPGDLVLLTFPFTDGLAAKRRPALVLLDTGNGDIVAARVTSQPAMSEFDVPIENWEKTNLKLPSVARRHKLVTYDKRLVARRLGRLPPGDWLRVVAVLQQLWAGVS
jgi:mRNA interferase MazF